MTVQDLISQLQLLDAELQVVVCSGDKDWQISDVRKTTHEGKEVAKIGLKAESAAPSQHQGVVVNPIVDQQRLNQDAAGTVI